MTSWQQLQDEIRQHSPKPDRVQILGACKAQPVEAVTARIADGLGVLGVNYVQEGQALRKALPNFKGEWHFIGAIQSRKAKDLIGYNCVQSLDRLSVAEELNRRLRDENTAMSVLIEVNIGGENTKAGIAPDDLPDFLSRLSQMSYLKIDGLMGMPPPLHPVEARRPHFKQLSELFEKYGHGRWRRLSMGTSDDYIIALQEGATVIRLGTVLFGERPPKTE